MLNSFRALKSCLPNKADPKLVYPLLRWASSSQIDVSWCQKVNKYLFFIDNNIALGMLAIGLKDKNAYIKYPKATKKIDDKQFELKKELIKKYYSWGDQEFDRNINMLQYIDWNDIAIALGCDKKERKVLGLKEIKLAKMSKQVVKKSKSLFDF